MVGGAQGGTPIGETRRMHTLEMAGKRSNPRLVLGDPPADPVAVRVSGHRCVLGEGVGGLAVAPPSCLLEGER